MAPEKTNIEKVARHQSTIQLLDSDDDNVIEDDNDICDLDVDFGIADNEANDPNTSTGLADIATELVALEVYIFLSIL